MITFEEVIEKVLDFIGNNKVQSRIIDLICESQVMTKQNITDLFEIYRDIND